MRWTEPGDGHGHGIVPGVVKAESQRPGRLWREQKKSKLHRPRDSNPYQLHRG